MIEYLILLIASALFFAVLGRYDPSFNFGNPITLLAILGAAFFLRFLWGLFYFPAKIYKELGGFEGGKLVVKPDCSKPNELDQIWFGFWLENRSEVEIHQCVVELQQVTKTEDAAFNVGDSAWLSWTS